MSVVSPTPGTLPRLLVVLATDAVGGAEVQTRALLQGLSAHYTLTLLTQRTLAGFFQPLLEAQTLHSLRCFEDHGLDRPFDYRPANFLAYARAIATEASLAQAQLVHAVMHNASLHLALARWRHPLAMRGRRLSGSLHGSLSGYFAQRGYPMTRPERLLTGMAMRTLDAVITPSRGVAQELIQHHGGRPRHVGFIYNGYDADHIRRQAAAAPAPRPAPGHLRICTSCRLSDQKDVATLVRALALLPPQVELRVVGDGPQRPAIETLAAALKVTDRLHITGFLHNPFGEIASADLFVLSSHYEGFGNVIIEALALGIPVIASDCPWGPAEIIRPGRDGELFPPADPAALAAILHRLIAHPEARAHLAAHAPARAAWFSHTRMVDGYHRAFAACLGACPPFSDPLPPSATDDEQP